jgi:WD40 repeat protein
LAHSFTAATPIHSLDISFDGTWVAGGGEGTIFLWNLLHPQSNYTLDSPALISVVQFSPQGDYLAYGTGEINSKIYQVGVRELTDDRVRRLMNRKQDWRQLPGFERRITSLAWDKPGDFLIASSDDGSIRVWEPRNDKVAASLQLPDPIKRFANVPDESLAVFVRESGTIKSWRWNDAAATEESAFTVPDAMDIAASSAGADLIAFAETSGKISVLQRRSGETIATLETDKDPVTGFTFVPESRILASGHQSGIVRLWDVDRSQEIQRFSKEFSPISAIDVTPDGRYVVAASLSGTVNIWQIP